MKEQATQSIEPKTVAAEQRASRANTSVNLTTADTTPTDTLNLRSVDEVQETAIKSIQVEQAIGNLPLFMIFHAAASLCLFAVATYPKTSIFLATWYVSALAIFVCSCIAIMLWRKPKWQRRPQTVLHGLEFLCFLFALVWALPLAAAAQESSLSNTITVVCITLAVMGITAMTLIRVPSGLIVFVSLVSAAMASTLYKSLPAQPSLTVVLCALYCLVLISVVLKSHLDFRRQSHAELDLSRQKDVVRLLLNDFERGTPDWIWEANQDGKLNYVSTTLTDALKLTPEYPIGKRLRHILEGHIAAEDLRQFDLKLDAAETLNNHPMTAVINGVTFHWRFTAQPIRDAANNVIGHRGVCRDVTASFEDHQRIEKAIIATEAATAAKSQFLAVMSHELRTPLNAIVGYSELLANDKTEALPSLRRREYASTIRDNSKHLMGLVNDVLDTASSERGTLKLAVQDVDAAETIEAAINQCRSQAEQANISIVARLIDNITVSVDNARIQQVIVNVLSNAVKFSEVGGIVNIEMQRGKDHALEIAIKDAGIGIASNDIERMFAPFVQSHNGLARNYQGAGLGLAIARRIIRLHDGDITLESTLGAGTIASITLPKHRVHWPVKNQQAIREVA